MSIWRILLRWRQATLGLWYSRDAACVVLQRRFVGNLSIYIRILRVSVFPSMPRRGLGISRSTYVQTSRFGPSSPVLWNGDLYPDLTRREERSKSVVLQLRFGSRKHTQAKTRSYCRSTAIRPLFTPLLSTRQRGKMHHNFDPERCTFNFTSINTPLPRALHINLP